MRARALEETGYYLPACVYISFLIQGTHKQQPLGAAVRSYQKKQTKARGKKKYEPLFFSLIKHPIVFFELCSLPDVPVCNGTDCYRFLSAHPIVTHYNRILTAF